MTDQTALFLSSLTALVVTVAFSFYVPSDSWVRILTPFGIGCGVAGMLRSMEARP